MDEQLLPGDRAGSRAPAQLPAALIDLARTFDGAAAREPGVVEARTFDVVVARAVTGLPGDEAQEVLDTLVEHRMLDTAPLPEGVGYRLNDLVRLFAREADGEPDQSES